MRFLPFLFLIACTAKVDDTSVDDTSADDTADTDTSEDTGTGEGAALYTTACSDCHGADGDSGQAPNLSEEVPGMTDQEITDIILNGQGYMQPVDVSEAEAELIVTYLRRTFG